MFNIVIYIDNMGEICEICCSELKSLFSICWVLDKSNHVKYWTLKDACPSHYGWTVKGWNKYRSKFTEECFKI